MLTTKSMHLIYNKSTTVMYWLPCEFGILMCVCVYLGSTN